jgi:uncharacterized membrane protein YqaE (UPF0057 family)
MRKLLGVIASIFLPPLGVLIGGGSVFHFILNIILTFTFWIPGVLHALFVVLTQDD